MLRPIGITAAIIFLISALSFILSEFTFVLAVVLLLLIIAFILYYTRSFQYVISLVVVLIYLGVLLFTHFNIAQPIEKLSEHTFDAKVAVTRVEYEEEMDYSVIFGSLESVQSNNINFCNCRLTKNGTTDILPGDEIVASVKFLAIDDEYKASSFADNVFIGGYIKSVDSHIKSANALNAFIYKLQCYVKDTVNRYLGGDEAGLVTAVIMGDDSGISDNTYGAIKVSGVSHMIVASGTHFALICAGFGFVIRKFMKNRIAISCINILLVFFIMTFCGFTMPILRAGIAYLILNLGIIIMREKDSLSALSATVIIVMLMNPFAFYSLSFLLTLGATFGVLVVSPKIDRAIFRLLKLKRIKLVSEFVSVVSLTVSSTVMTLPMLLYYYDSVSTLSLVTNVLINHAMAALLIISIFGALFGGIKFLAYPCFILCGLCAKYSLYVINFIGNLDIALINFNGHATAVALCIIYFAVYLFYIFYKRRKGNI